MRYLSTMPLGAPELSAFRVGARGSGAYMPITGCKLPLEDVVTLSKAIPQKGHILAAFLAAGRKNLSFPKENLGSTFHKFSVYISNM